MILGIFRKSFDKEIKFSLFKVLTILCLICFFLRKTLLEIYLASYDDKWGVGDWLINYEGGFVRRGLPGQIIYNLSNLFNISPITLVQLFSIISVIGFIFVFRYFVFRFIPLTFILSPFLLNLPHVVRKDFLMLFLFGLNLVFIHLYAKGKIKNIFQLFILTNLISISALLSHEKYIFFAMPSIFIFLNIIIFNKKDSFEISFKSFLKSLTFLLPTAIFSLAALTYRGDLETSNDILTSWMLIKDLIGNSDLLNIEEIKILPINKDFLGSIYNSAIGSLSWDISTAIEVRNLNLKFFYVWPLFYLVGISCFLASRNKEYFELKLQIIVLQIFFMSPLIFYISCDYGRLLFYLLSSSCLIYGFIMHLNLKNKLKINFNLRYIFTYNFLKKIDRDGYLNLSYLFIRVPICCLSVENLLRITDRPIFSLFFDILIIFKKFLSLI